MKLRKLFLLLLLLGTPLLGETAKSKAGSQKSLDFEGELVEGMNKQPLDSLSQLSDRDSKKAKKHLYKKRSSYTEENSLTLKEITE